MKHLLILFSLIFLSAMSQKPAQSQSLQEGSVINKTLKLVGPQFDNKVIKNITIENVKGDGIYIKNVKNLSLENITIKNVTGSGIRLGISGPTESVTIINNTIINTGKNGINAGQRYKKNIDHKNLRIIGNKVVNTGLKGKRGLYHGLYIQSQDFYIENNTIQDAKDGNGISVRSSGIIKNNSVENTAKSGISYYSDHMRGRSNHLIITGNTVSGFGKKSSRGAIDILPIQKKKLTVENFTISNNKVPVNSINVHKSYKTPQFNIK